jgi:type IV pilus assembly protein PilC
MWMPGARVRLKSLAQLCNRLSISLDAGLDIRKVWRSESENCPSPRLRRECSVIRDRVEQGDSLTDAIKATDQFFPPLFIELVEVGEETANLPQTFSVLNRYYLDRVKSRRTFLGDISGTLVQFAAAICVVGVLLAYFGSSFAFWLFFSIVVGSVLALIVLIRAFARRAAWTEPIARFVYKAPYLRSIVRLMSLTRLARSMQLTFATGIDLRRAIEISFRSSMHPKYRRQTRPVLKLIDQGYTIGQAMQQTGVFPVDFVSMVDVGEQAGQLPETMERVANNYQDRANDYIKPFLVILKYMVWLPVAILIATMVFMGYAGYIQMIRQNL